MTRNKLATLALTGITALALTACGSNASKQSNSIPKSVNKETTITFWHGMSGTQKDTLTKLVSDFEKQNPKIKVKLQYQGNYGQLQSKINSTLQSQKDLPNITQAYPNWLWIASQNDLLVDLKPYLKGNKANIDNAYWQSARIKGEQYGYPFSKSTEALFYNKTLLDKYKLPVPKTLKQLESVSKSIYEKSHHKTAGVGFDHLGNYMILAGEDKGVTFKDGYKLTDKVPKSLVNYYLHGVRKGYFRIAGSEHYLSSPFANEKVAMFVGTSAGESFVKLGVGNKFSYGVTHRPTKTSIIQGTDLYIFSKSTPMQRLASFKLMQFLTSAKSQKTWALKTGYLPINSKSFTAKQARLSNSKVVQNLFTTNGIGKGMTYSVPANSKNVTNAYNTLSTELERILSQPNNHDDKGNLEIAQHKLDASWKQ